MGAEACARQGAPVALRARPRRSCCVGPCRTERLPLRFGWVVEVLSLLVPPRTAAQDPAACARAPKAVLRLTLPQSRLFPSVPGGNGTVRQSRCPARLAQSCGDDEGSGARALRVSEFTLGGDALAVLREHEPETPRKHVCERAGILRRVAEHLPSDESSVLVVDEHRGSRQFQTAQEYAPPFPAGPGRRGAVPSL